jgi:hypothetical protein
MYPIVQPMVCSSQPRVGHRHLVIQHVKLPKVRLVVVE